MKKKYHISDILKYCGEGYKIIGSEKNCYFDNPKPVFESNEKSITWVKSSRKDVYELLKNTNAGLILCDNKINIKKFKKKHQTILVVKDPKYSFFNIVNNLFAQKTKNIGIHSSSFIDKYAEIDSSVYIGPFCYIGKCKIGKGTHISAYTRIYDDVVIGKNVLIHDHCTLGVESFGYFKDKKNINRKMRHIGKTIIEDEVELLPYVNVDKGTLDVTFVGKGTKIAHYTLIGHNCIIGRNNIITASIVFCGGSKLGDNCWVGVGSVIKEKVAVGNNVTIGLGSIVTKDVPDNETVTGYPAVSFENFRKILDFQKKLF